MPAIDTGTPAIANPAPMELRRFGVQESVTEKKAMRRSGGRFTEINESNLYAIAL